MTSSLTCFQICMVDEATCAALDFASGGGATSFATESGMSEDNLDGDATDGGGGQRGLGPAARRRVRKKKRRSGSLSRYSWVPSNGAVDGGGGKKLR